jgi:hypothetical protein
MRTFVPIAGHRSADRRPPQCRSPATARPRWGSTRRGPGNPGRQGLRRRVRHPPPVPRRPGAPGPVGDGQRPLAGPAGALETECPRCTEPPRGGLSRRGRSARTRRPRDDGPKTGSRRDTRGSSPSPPRTEDDARSAAIAQWFVRETLADRDGRCILDGETPRSTTSTPWFGTIGSIPRISPIGRPMRFDDREIGDRKRSRIRGPTPPVSTM